MNGQAVLLTAAAIGITLICLLSVIWLGPIGAMLNLLTPVAAAYVVMRYGWQTGAVVMAVVSLLLIQFASIQVLAAYLGLFGMGSLVLPSLLRRGVEWDRAVFASCLAALLLMAGLLAATLASEGIAHRELVARIVQAEVEQAMQIYRDSGVSGSQLDALATEVERIAVFIQQTFWGLFLAGVLAVQMLCLAILQRLRQGYFRIAGVPFSQWRLPGSLVWLLIAAGFALLVPYEPVALIGQNLLAVVLPVYFLQGLAVVSSYLQKRVYSPFIKGMIYLLLFILSPLPLVITGVGVFDLWIDFRRPRKKEY